VTSLRTSAWEANVRVTDRCKQQAGLFPTFLSLTVHEETAENQRDLILTLDTNKEATSFYVSYWHRMLPSLLERKAS